MYRPLEREASDTFRGISMLLRDDFPFLRARKHKPHTSIMPMTTVQKALEKASHTGKVHESAVRAVYDKVCDTVRGTERAKDKLSVSVGGVIISQNALLVEIAGGQDLETLEAERQTATRSLRDFIGRELLPRSAHITLVAARTGVVLSEAIVDRTLEYLDKYISESELTITPITDRLR